MSDTNAKLTALASLLEGALNVVREGVNVETRYRRASETGGGPKEQRDVLGDPVYYLEVLPASASPLDRDPSGDFTRRADEFQVVFMFEYKDADRRADSSQPVFNDLFDTLYESAEQGYLPTDDVPQTVEVGDATHNFTVLDDRSPIIAHESTFSVTLTDFNQ